MKKILIVGGLVIAVIAGLVFYISNAREKPCLTCEKNTGKGKTQEVKFADYFVDETDLCNVLTKETVAGLLGKSIVKTESVTRSTLKSCQYFLNDTDALVLNYDLTAVDSKLQGHESLGRIITTNPKIIAKHSVVLQENGLINEIYLVIGPSEFVSINRPNSKLISEEEIVSFAAKLGEIVSGIVPLTITKIVPTEGTSDSTVPLPQETDIINTFFNLIEERRPSDAVGMMASSITGDDSQKQAWAVQFNAIKSMTVLKVEPSMPEEWTNSEHSYKTTLEVTIDPDTGDEPIPYFGWENGQNIRWVTIVKENNLWKIEGLATGP